jgi:hypothetical protein
VVHDFGGVAAYLASAGFSRVNLLANIREVLIPIMRKVWGQLDSANLVHQVFVFRSILAPGF